MNDAENIESSKPRKPIPQERALFRQQAIDSTSAKQYGTVILTTYVNHRYLAAFFCALAVAIVLFFIFFKTASKSEISGILLPSEGVISVRSAHAGIVTQINVKEGQRIKAGDVLFVLSNERNIRGHQSAEKMVSKLLKNRSDSYHEELSQASQQSNQRASAAKRRAAALLEERARLDSQIVMQSSRVTLVAQAFQRFKDLHATNYISAAQLEEKEGEFLDQRQRLAELERLKGVNGRDFSSVEADLRDLHYQAQRDEAMLKRSVLAIEQDLAESEARREILVTAPITGTVTAIAVEAGKSVLSDSTLASLLPAGSDLEAEIYAPSRSIGFVKPGMTVLLRYQAYPYQKFGQYEAVVHEIAGTSISAQELALPGTAAVSNKTSEPLYRVRVKLRQQTVVAYGKRIDLRAGMLLNASIILEHRRLYEWVLEPLFTISGRN
jgi:membrane fusion protein